MLATTSNQTPRYGFCNQFLFLGQGTFFVMSRLASRFLALDHGILTIRRFDHRGLFYDRGHGSLGTVRAWCVCVCVRRGSLSVTCLCVGDVSKRRRGVRTRRRFTGLVHDGGVLNMGNTCDDQPSPRLPFSREKTDRSPSQEPQVRESGRCTAIQCTWRKTCTGRSSSSPAGTQESVISRLSLRPHGRAG
jgi:hypothetical protein